MKIGYLFAGQGQQFYQMGVDLSSNFEVAHEVYAQAKRILGYDVLNLNEDALNDSQFIQPAIYVLNVAIERVLKSFGIKPDVVAGLSLGEYNALTSAGVLEFEDGLELVRARAELMNAAFKPFETGMAACLKVETTRLESMLAGTDVEICNYNSPTNHVIGGKIEHLAKVIETLRLNKILVIPLKMSTVSHMSLLKETGDKFYEILTKYNFSTPSIPFINNVRANYQQNEFHKTLSEQLYTATRMGEIIQIMYDDGVDCFIEIGPKGSISRLVKEIYGSKIRIFNVYDMETLDGVLYE